MSRLLTIERFAASFAFAHSCVASLSVHPAPEARRARSQRGPVDDPGVTTHLPVSLHRAWEPGACRQERMQSPSLKDASGARTSQVLRRAAAAACVTATRVQVQQARRSRASNRASSQSSSVAHSRGAAAGTTAGRGASTGVPSLGRRAQPAMAHAATTAVTAAAAGGMTKETFTVCHLHPFRPLFHPRHRPFAVIKGTPGTDHGSTSFPCFKSHEPRSPDEAERHSGPRTRPTTWGP